MRAYWEVRQNDTQRTFVALGGDSGLRGYPAQYFYGFGASRILSNLEYRSLPLKLQSVHIGGVLFYDAGTVYRRLSSASFHHSAGAGLRVLFPQLNRTVFRLDAGFPLDTPGIGVQLTYSSDQVVPLTDLEDRLAAADPNASVRQSL
jgi:outer membrane protein assembly factor BamA